MNGKVNRCNVRICGNEQPLDAVEDDRDSPKLTLFGATTKTKACGPFYFVDKKVTGISQLDKIQFSGCIQNREKTPIALYSKKIELHLICMLKSEVT